MSNEGTAYNRAYLASAIAFAEIPLRETSDTPGALSEIHSAPLKKENYLKEKEVIKYIHM